MDAKFFKDFSCFPLFRLSIDGNRLSKHLQLWKTFFEQKMFQKYGEVKFMWRWTDEALYALHFRHFALILHLMIYYTCLPFFVLDPYKYLKGHLIKLSVGPGPDIFCIVLPKVRSRIPLSSATTVWHEKLWDLIYRQSV